MIAGRVFSISSIAQSCYGSSWKRAWMAVFVAYFDASGDPDDPACRVLTVAGWIAPEAKWRRLERAWKAVCGREGVSGLHMKDFAHSRHEFTTWKGDEPRRQRFLSDLAQIIRHYTNREFSHSMFLDGYRAVNAQYELRERVGSPYALGAWLSISAVQDWMRKTHPDDDVLFVFEKGDGDEGAIIGQRVFSRICGSLPAPGADPAYGTGRFLGIGTSGSRTPFWWSVSLCC